MFFWRPMLSYFAIKYINIRNKKWRQKPLKRGSLTMMIWYLIVAERPVCLPSVDYEGKSKPTQSMTNMIPLCSIYTQTTQLIFMCD